ncbi:unnamed protein product [Cylicocyclus nassatus]|uniref:DUF5641 domain-containing protein n=1 Tax=Cylicocyclus nassatus TaxID=53992 RepID=A0AA36MDW1_CYLNA|nr:unnamed protein product [Cylicocyclus nassatus]
MYLKSHLRGPAANIIAGFQSTVENYDDAVRILTNTYGRPEILRNKLWDKLLQLPPASESPQSQRATLCAVRATWTQLQHLKEDSSAIGTLRIIRAKFPRRTRERIGEFKNKGDPMWTVDELLDTLDTIIDRLENIEDADPSDYHSYNSQSVVRQHSLSPRRYPSEYRTGEAFTRYRTPSRSRRSPSRSLSPRSRHERSSSPYYPRRASYSPTRSRRAAPSDVQCAFCHNFGHLPDRCRTIPDARQRRVFVSRHKLCWLCLQPDHTYIDCDEPLCPYCSRIHHRSLCLKTLSVPRSPSPSPRQRYQDSHRSQSPRRVQFSEEAYRPSSRTSTRASSRGFQSRSPPPSRNRFSPTPSRRTSLSRRSRSPMSAVHSANCTLDVHGTTNDTRSDSPDDHSPARTDVHPPSSCTSVCHDQSTPQEPRLMVVHAVTRNYKTNKSELLTVFLDSGSQYSFICTALAKHLGLSFRNTRTITTLTFGGHQYTESSEVTLTLWDQYDYPIQLELWTREKITTVPRTNNCYDSTIVDPADRVEVDVLLGIDNYWRVVDLHRNEKLPSGLILSHTRFGPVLSGIQHPVVSNTLSTIHNFSDEDEPESERSIRSFLGLDVLGLDEGEDVDADVIRQFFSKDPANRLKEQILANTYVDNLIIGADSNQECLTKCKQCKDIFARMCMNLREFMSNSQSTMLSIPEHDRMTIHGHFVKFLGIKWDPKLDVLHVPINIAHQPVTSKRTALRVYASTFDPLGLLTPLLVRPKMFIQDLWEAGYDWDDPFTEEDAQRWNNIVQEMSDFHSHVPRYLGSTCDDAYDLVLCSDASKRIYATVAYVLTCESNNKPQSTLFFAKAKLAPPGAITIPRMELLACHMAAKMAKFLIGQCKVSFRSIRFLTDSQIVLYWIQSRKPLKTYVANRVRYIRRVLDELRADNIATGFYYLDTDNNPADCATRGLTASEFQNHMWWTGPSFFMTPSSQWPWKNLEPSVTFPPGAEVEELKVVTTSMNTILESYTSFVPFTRTNSYTKLVRVTAYVLKFLAKVRHRARTRCHHENQDTQSILSTMDTTPVVTPKDFTTAESLLIREHYRECQQRLNSSYMKKFRTTCDEDGIIRIEAILNTRPLFPVNSSDPDTNVAIRPIDLITSDFQVARLTGNIPQKIANASSESYRALRTRYKSLQEDLDHFWQLWQTEYLDALAQRQVRRTNGQSSKKPPRVGEVVLVKQDAHRSTWPLALILELYTSSDGNIRSAKIRTAKKKILERSINHLVPLEIVADEETIPERGYEQHLAVKDTPCGTSKE